MSDKMQEEFTEWAAKQFDIPQSLIVWTGEHPDDGYPVRVINEGEQSDEVNSLFGIAWLAFQASRAALVVELPSPLNITYKSDAGENHDIGNFYADKQFIEALTKAGVTVK